jgi:hypothetical protein
VITIRSRQSSQSLRVNEEVTDDPDRAALEAI